MRTQISLPPRRGQTKARSLIVKTVVVALLALSATWVAATPASAGGKTGYLYNCFTQWWNTAFAQGCDSPGAKYSGRYESEVDCTFADGGRIYVRRWQKEETGLYNGGDCTYGAQAGQIKYVG